MEWRNFVAPNQQLLMRAHTRNVISRTVPEMSFVDENAELAHSLDLLYYGVGWSWLQSAKDAEHLEMDAVMASTTVGQSLLWRAAGPVSRPVRLEVGPRGGTRAGPPVQHPNHLWREGEGDGGDFVPPSRVMDIRQGRWLRVGPQVEVLRYRQYPPKACLCSVVVEPNRV